MEDTIIEKAKQGGWNDYDGERDLWDAVIDPRFWEALGKACGWETEVVCSFCGELVASRYFREKPSRWCTHDNKSTKARWKREYHALRFHEINLTEGWSKAEAYLSELIT